MARPDPGAGAAPLSCLLPVAVTRTAVQTASGTGARNGPVARAGTAVPAGVRKEVGPAVRPGPVTKASAVVPVGVRAGANIMALTLTSTSVLTRGRIRASTLARKAAIGRAPWRDPEVRP